MTRNEEIVRQLSAKLRGEQGEQIPVVLERWVAFHATKGVVVRYTSEKIYNAEGGLKGWKGKYVVTVIATGEIPAKDNYNNPTFWGRQSDDPRIYVYARVFAKKKDAIRKAEELYQKYRNRKRAYTPRKSKGKRVSKLREGEGVE